MTVQEQFLEWLKTVPEELAGLVTIIKKFLEQQYPEVPAGDGSGPIEVHAGQEQALTTVGLSWEEIDKLNLSMADAVVKEKAIVAVKAFLAGATLLRGVL